MGPRVPVYLKETELKPTIVTRESRLKEKPTRFGLSTEYSGPDFSSGRRRHKEKKGNQKGRKKQKGESKRIMIQPRKSQAKYTRWPELKSFPIRQQRRRRFGGSTRLAVPKQKQNR
jgi:hypothetical protein